MTPQSRKLGYGLLLGCRLELDGGHCEQTFFLTIFEKRIGQKPEKSSLPVLIRHRNRSGVVELFGREPLTFAKVENGVTKSCRFFRRENRKIPILAWNFPLFFSSIACCSRESTSAWQNFRQKQPKKKKKKSWVWVVFFKSGRAHSGFNVEFSFFLPRKN